MKKTTLLAFLLSMCFSVQAQLSYEASVNYAKMYDLTYDALVPNKMYAITLNNHIVVSFDNGLNWDILFSMPGTSTYIQDLKLLGTAALSFGTGEAIHILSLETNTIEASIPVPQSGVAGANPSYLSSYDIQNSTYQSMIVNTGFSIGFSNYGKTFITDDGGQNWEEIYYTLENDNVFINNVAMSPLDDKRIFLARGLGDNNIDGGIWLSINGGQDFTESLGGYAFEAISFNPANSAEILLGTSISFGLHPENLYKSTDSGETWTVIPITWTNETLDNITKIVYNPVNPNKIIVLDENEIARTDDGGENWVNTVYPVGIAMDYYYGINASYNPFNENQIVITTDFYPQFSTDGGATLTQINAPFLNTQSVSVAKYGSVSHLYYGAQGGRLHKTLPAGTSDAYDTEQPDSFNPKRNYMIADPAVPGRVFTYASMGFFGGFLNVSNDYGATTTSILQAFSDDIQELTVDPANSNIIYVSMRSGESSQVYKIDFSDTDNIVVTDIITPEMNEFGDGVVTGILIGATSNEIYIAKKTKVFKSIDGGENWEEKSLGLENLSDADIIWDFVKNPLNANQFTVATNIGVFGTTDAAENWMPMLEGRDVRRVKHSPNNDNVVVGAIFSSDNTDAGIVYSTDFGANWDEITNEQLAYVQSGAMDFLFEGNTIEAYVATSDLGIVKYVISGLPLGIKNPSMAGEKFRIYPNPASSEINILSVDDAEIASVSVFSILGQQMMESRNSRIDVSSLSTGTYIVKVTATNGKSAVQKLIKK